MNTVLKRSEKIGLLLAALERAKEKIKPPTKEDILRGGHGHYVPIESLFHLIREPLKENNLILIQHSYNNERDRSFLTTTLFHTKSGEWLEMDTPLLLEKQTPQSLGSAITYARRYAISSLFMLKGEEDDDGANAESQHSSNHSSQKQIPYTENGFSSEYKKKQSSDKPQYAKINQVQIKQGCLSEAQYNWIYGEMVQKHLTPEDMRSLLNKYSVQYLEDLSRKHVNEIISNIRNFSSPIPEILFNNPNESNVGNSPTHLKVNSFLLTEEDAPF